ncbi:MAG: DEAD/DEAH box helicase family protein, partial [Bdellovibrionales bacterium]|nr:DEAD/DEAH box helicase family protein [Bdellovibrionales bacterium]
WKQITLADPLLYERHFLKQIKPEPYQYAAASKLITSLMTEGTSVCYMATGTGKTVVNWLVWDKFSQIDSALNASLGPGRHLFIVDRNIILSEAIDKLKNMYGSRFKIGCAFDGIDDFDDAQVIFATPSSLVSQGRLQRIINGGRISLVTFDETHHLPAAELTRVYRTLEKANKDKGWKMAMLGLSATIIRSDKRSVTRFYGRNVTVCYDKLDGYQDGNLVGIRYFPADMLLDRSVGLYSRRNYLPLYGIYQQGSRESLDKRSLFVCPKIDKANDLADFFNKQAHAEGRPPIAVALHSELLMKNPKYFEAVYTAWKNQAWPEDSEWKNDPVPEVVMAVDMLGEGIDVPGIANIFLWRKGGLLLPFIQTLGRGLRVSPFKPFVNVYDIGGAYHEKKIFGYLQSIGSMVEWQGIDLDLEQAKRLQIPDNGRVAYRVNSGHPEHLSYVFGNYDSLPGIVIGKLDDYLAQELSFKSTSVFKENLAELGQQLLEDSSDAKAHEIRQRLLPAFDELMFAHERFNSPLQRTPASLFVFLRLSELLFPESAVDISPMVYKIFPEFSPEHEKILRNRSANLATLRKLTFGLTTPLFFTRLYNDLVVSKLIDHTIGAGFDYLHDDVEKEKNTFIDFAERKVDPPKIGITNTVGSAGDARATRGGEHWQDALISVLMQHPLLRGRIQPEDFSLPSKDFTDLIKNKGLFADSQAQANYFFKSMRQARTTLNKSEHIGDVLVDLKVLVNSVQNLNQRIWKDTLLPRGQLLLEVSDLVKKLANELPKK